MALPLFCNLQTRFISSSHHKQVFFIKTNHKESSALFPTKSNKRISPLKSASVNGYSAENTSNQKVDFSTEGNGKLSENPRRLIEFIRDLLPGGSWWRLSTDHVDVVLTAKPVTIVRALQRMWELISEDRWVIFISFASLILTALSEISIPHYLTASIFSAQSNNISVFHRNVRLLILLCITSGICSGIRGCCFGIANMIMVKRMRERLYSTLLLQEISFFDSQTVGDLTSRLGSDCQQVSRVIGNDLNLISRNLLQGTGALIYLLILSLPLGLCILAICSALATAMLLYGQYQKKSAKLTQDFGASANEVARETLSLMRTVRVYGTEQQELKRYNHWLGKVAGINLRQSAAYGLWNFSFNTLYHSTQVIAVLIGGIFILTGRITAEQLTKFILYSEWLIYSTWWVGDNLSSLMQSIGASEKVFQLMDLPPSNQFISKGSKWQRLMGHVEMLNVSFCYPSRDTVPVLQNINFQVHPNEVVAIAGLSGSGKSSLVNLLLRLYEPTSGKIMIDGYPINNLDIKWLRERIGYVGQEPRLFRTDISSNIRYGCTKVVSQKDVEWASKQAYAHEFISSLPNGYQTLVDDDLLSGGQKQRIAIARAILRDPDILIFDEATSALDAESEHNIKGVLREVRSDLKTKRTVIVIAHRLSTIQAADRIVVMEGGKIVEVGSHSELLLKDGLYSRLTRRQADAVEWGTANWGHHHSWEYQANNNEEVWAAKARAWAAAKAASDIQQPQQLPYAFQDGNFAGDSTTVFAGGDSSIIPSVHQQEVPSSYSSITGDSIRGIDPVATMPSDYNFVPPAEPAILYPSVPAVLLSGPQVDPSVAVPPPVTGHSAPIFGRIPGPSFQPTVSSVTAPFGIGAGLDMHPGTAFSGDAFGAPIASERPKKASVPNWLREEIIKKKPVIVNSAAQLLEEDTQSIEDEGVDKSYGNGDQGDRKITESPRSTEDGDDDEDDVEEARNAAINQEIKRVLTEVLLKVTDELFDEIATKVLSEDDLTDEVDQGISYLDRKSPTFTPRIATSKASAKVVVPVKTRDINSNDASEKSNSSFRGDVLGLASYASDDDDHEIESSGKQSFVENNIQQQSISSRLSKGTDVVENGGPQGETKEHFDNPESHLDSTSQNATTVNHSVAVSELKDERAAKTSNVDSGMTEHEVLDVEASTFEKTLAVKVAGKSDKLVENHTSRKSVTDDSLGQEIRDKSDKTDRCEHERSYSGRNHSVKEFEIDKESAYEKERTYSRHDEKHIKKERRDEQNGSKERVKEKGVKSAEKAKDSDTRKKLSPDHDKESKKERHAGRRAGVKEENDRKRERTKDDKREKPRHRNSTESGRHKRHRSSSPTGRVRDNKDGLVVGHASDLSDDSSENSKKKLHSKRRKSPSPVRSRKRQVSRSPHSKHSQRRHSPYSSLEASRGRRSRSRSRSPMRRKR